MNERDFIYWLQGFLELSKTTELTEEQVNIIKAHIALVLCKVTVPNVDLTKVPFPSTGQRKFC